MTIPPTLHTSQPASSLEQTLDIETPEQVVVSYTLAGVGTRAVAAIIDYLICLGWSLALTVPTCFAVRAMPETTRSITAPWLLAMYILLQFAVLWGYYVRFEGLADGKTPGKRRQGLRVVQDGGYSVSFAASAVRNLVRFIDMQPLPFYAVGILSAALSKSGKRIGDMVAGTIVVREREVHVRPVPVEPPPPDMRPLSTLLTDDEFALLERFMARRQGLEPARRRALAEQLATRFHERMGEGSAEGNRQPALVRLFERERSARAHGAAARSDTGAAREQHAIVALGAPAWHAFARRLSDVQRRGLRNLPEHEVSEFVAAYRELSTDLARLRTAARGREIDALFYLSRLVAAGHNLLYRQRQLVGRTIWRFIAVTVPREIRRSWAPIAGAAGFLLVPAGIAFTAVRAEAARAREFIPAVMIDRAEGASRRAEEGRGYIDDPELFRPVMASGIIANNVQVTYVAFALGVTAGIGTVLLLVFNGIHLGGFAGLYAALGVGEQLLAFAAPHGVLELTAISIAGGAGLLLASAILLPGALTRRDALVVNGRRAIRVIAASTLLLVIAGTIEGLISPIEYWDLSLKLVVSAATALFLAVYLTRGRGADPEAPAEQNAYSNARALISR